MVLEVSAEMSFDSSAQAAWSCANVHGLWCYWRLCWCPWTVPKPCWRLWTMLPSGIMLVSKTTHSVTEGRVDVCSPCYHWKPWMRMSMVCVVPWIYVDVYGLCCSQKPCGRLWSRLPLTIRGKEAFCCGIDNWSLTVKMRGIEGFSDNPSPLPLHPLKEKLSRPEAFKENA